jgi:hypothetical protein
MYHVDKSGPSKALHVPLYRPCTSPLKVDSLAAAKAARLPFEQTVELKLVPERVLEPPGMKHNSWINRSHYSCDLRLK